MDFLTTDMTGFRNNDCEAAAKDIISKVTKLQDDEKSMRTATNRTSSIGLRYRRNCGSRFVSKRRPMTDLRLSGIESLTGWKLMKSQRIFLSFQ